MAGIKRMDIKEFQNRGYLQEANRLFFHPLGLALEVIINDEDGSVRLGGIWDSRDDPEGIMFDDFDRGKAHTVRIESIAKRNRRYTLECCDDKGIQIWPYDPKE